MWKGAVECLFEVSSSNLPVGTEKNQRNSSLGRWSIDRDLNFGYHHHATGDAKPKYRNGLVAPFTVQVMYFIDKMETASLFRHCQVTAKVHGVTWNIVTL
jgi:hypothetical protein